MAIRAMHHRNAPAFLKAFYLRHAVFYACSKDQLLRLKLFPFLGSDHKAIPGFFSPHRKAVQKSNGLVPQNLLFSLPGYNTWLFPIVGNKIMRMWRLPVAWQSAVNDQHLS